MRHVWILLRLRWRLIIASFAGRTGRKAAAILGFVMILIWAASFGVSSFALVRGAGDWDPEKADLARNATLKLIFALTFALQLMTGVAFLSVSDFFDTSRLLHLPVRARSIFLAMLLSSVISPSTLVFGSPAFGAMIALPGDAPAQALRFVVVMGLLLFGQACSLFAGYLLLLALSRRRLRDLATIIGSVLGVGSYALIRLVMGKPKVILQWVGTGPVGTVLDAFPPSWFAALIASDDPAAPGDWGRVALAASALGLSLVLGGWAFSKFYESAGEGSDADDTTRAAPGQPKILTASVGAIMNQTFAIVWREPQLKAMLFQQMVFLLLPMLTLTGGRSVASAMWTIPFFIVFSHAWMALSLLGIDGPGLKLLLQSPILRSRLLLGRVLAVGRLFALIDVVAVAVLTLIMTFVGGVADPWRRFFEMTLACLVADGIMVGAGAFISVLAPFPLVRRSRTMRMRQEGCATNFGRAFLRIPVMMLALAIGFLTTFPSIAGIGRVWYVVTVPAGMLVTALVIMLGIARGARRLLDREELILAALGDSGE